MSNGNGFQADGKRDSGIGDLFRRWFKGKEAGEEEIPTPGGGPKPVETSVPAPHIATEAASPPAPKPHPIAEKIAALKRTVEFGQPLKSRLNKVSSSHDLLLYSYEVLLSKFIALQEIGMLSAESSLVLDALHQKFETILVKPEGPGSEAVSATVEKLKEENRELQAQVGHLRAKLAKGDIISEKELQLEDETKFLQRRQRELKAQLEVADKKIETLSLSAEMVQSLRARNSLLTARLEHQAQLLRSLTANKPEQDELIERIQETSLENRRLKGQLTEQAGWLDKMQQRFSGDASSQQAIDALLRNNSSLQDELDVQEEGLDGLTAKSTYPRFTETIERLSDENFRLKALMETKQAIQDYMEDPRETGGDAQQIIDVLKLENRRLQETLAAKKEQVELLAHTNPATETIMKTVVRIRGENQQLRKENEQRERLYREVKAEKDQLQRELRKLDLLTEENRRLKAKFDQSLQVIQVLKKSETQLQVMKKEYAVLRTKYQATEVESQNAKARLSKVVGQYEMLMREYENLFGQMDH